MFARWCQEIFFKYMRQEYDIDRMLYYAVQEIDSKMMVVNQRYSKLTQALKKTREKISRNQAQLFVLNEENINSELETASGFLEKQMKIKKEIEGLKVVEKQTIALRKEQPYKIAIKNMPDDERYTKLDMEGKLFQNIIKMICYRAETVVAQLIGSDIYAKQDEIRLLIKSIIKTKGDLIPDYQNKTLTVKFYN